MISSDNQGGLPFKGWKKHYNKANRNFVLTRSYENIKNILLDCSNNRPEIKTVIIDTIYYVIMQEYMDKAKKKGFDKYVEMGLHFWELLNLIDTLREDMVVFIMAHSDTTEFNIREFAVPGGKLVKEKIKPQGLSRVVLETNVTYTDGKPKFEFLTQHSGDGLAKAPEDMFPDQLIPNDLNYVRQQMMTYDDGDEEVPAPAKAKKAAPKVEPVT